MRKVIDLPIYIFVGFFVVQVQLLHVITKCIANEYGIENYSAELRNTISTDLDENKCLGIAPKKYDEQHQKPGGNRMQIER